MRKDRKNKIVKQIAVICPENGCLEFTVDNKGQLNIIWAATHKADLQVEELKEIIDVKLRSILGYCNVIGIDPENGGSIVT